MEVIKGVVEQISIKDRKTGKYGDFANYGIKVNDSWYNGVANADKKTGEIIVKDKNYNVVKEGMEVEFVLEERNGFSSINSKMFTILSSGSSVPEQEQPKATKVKDTYVDKNDINVYVGCLQAAAMLAKGTTFQVGDKEPEKFSTEMAIRMADYLYKKAIDHATLN